MHAVVAACAARYACASIAIKDAQAGGGGGGTTGGAQPGTETGTGTGGAADKMICRSAPNQLPFCAGLRGEIEISATPVSPLLVCSQYCLDLDRVFLPYHTQALLNMGDVDTALRGDYLFNLNSTRVRASCPCSCSCPCSISSRRSASLVTPIPCLQQVFQHAGTSGCAEAYKVWLQSSLFPPRHASLSPPACWLQPWPDIIVVSSVCRLSQRYLCGAEFPACGKFQKGGACRSSCFAFAELCGLDDSHADLYPCAANNVLCSMMLFRLASRSLAGPWMFRRCR